MFEDFRGMGRNFWLFAIGRFISQLGWAVQDVALPLYVLDQTHSGSMMTAFILAEIIPSLSAKRQGSSCSGLWFWME